MVLISFSYCSEVRRIEHSNVDTRYGIDEEEDDYFDDESDCLTDEENAQEHDQVIIRENISVIRPSVGGIRYNSTNYYFIKFSNIF